MNKILHSTSRGQVTLPKDWRDKFDTDYYQAEIQEDKIIIIPLKSTENFEGKVEKAWDEYKNGEVIEGSELMKKYGL